MSSVPEHHTPCTNQLCAHFRRQHGLITQRCNGLEKELDAMRLKHDALYNQVVTRGEASLAREAATGEGGLRMPNGELMTAEKFMAKTRMMNQCMASLQASEKRARQLAAENEGLKQERDALYASVRKLEDRLNGFERARHYEVFTDEMHRETLRENDQLVDEIDELRCAERVLREDNGILRRRLAACRARIRGRRDPRPRGRRRRADEESSDDGGERGRGAPVMTIASIPIPRKRGRDPSPTLERRHASARRKRRVDSDAEEERNEAEEKTAACGAQSTQ